MHYIKLFENFSKSDIKSICKKYEIEKYKINKDGSIDVKGDVDLYYRDLTKIPLVFNKVNGTFDISGNKLVDLDGSPKIVNGDFFCNSNNLVTLRGCPDYIEGVFGCYDNELTSIDYFPNHIGHSFDCSNNQLTSLKGFIYNTDIDLFVSENPLPQEILDAIQSNEDNISQIVKLQDEFMIWNSNGTLNKHNFQELLKEIK